MSDKQQRREFIVKGLNLGITLIVANVSFPVCLRVACAAEKSQKTLPGAEKQKAIEELAYCGFACENECDIYKATLENDMKAKQAISKRWADRFGVSIEPEDVACDGCRSKAGRLSYYCGSVCDVRKCGISRGINSCAVCADFPSCKKKLWKDWPEIYQLTKERYNKLKKMLSIQKN